MTSLTYLQAGFWENLSSESSNRDGFERFENMLNVSKALSNSVVITDVSESSIKEDLFLKILIKQDKYQRCDSNYINKKIEGLDSSSDVKDLCATYLIDNQLLCDGYKNQFGIFCLTSYDVCKKKMYTGGDAVLFDQQEKASNYDKCKEQLSTPNNSLIVIDPYLFDEEHYINTALIPLLDKILPRKLQIPFHITIFSQPLNSLKWGNTSISKQEDIFPYFNKLIKGIRKDLIISLTLCHSTKTSERINGIKGDFHARYFLTNCLMVHAEDGLDLYGKNEKCGKWSRFVFVWPSLDNNQRKDVDEYYRWIEITSKNIQNPNKCVEKWGTSENRLFDLINSDNKSSKQRVGI